MNQHTATQRCPNCHAPILKTLPIIKIVGCQNCGNISELSEDDSLRSIKKYQLLDKRYQEPFYLGKQLKYKAETYMVTAIYLYYVDYEEWDSEDSKWVTDAGYITEWYAFSKQNKQLIIMSDVDEKFYIMSNPVPFPASKLTTKKNEKEIGKFQLYGFVGNDDCALETEGYYRAFSNFTIESSKIDFRDVPIKQYQLQRLYPTQVKRMILLDEMDKLQATEDFKVTTFYRNIFGFALIAIFFLLFYNIATNESGVKAGKTVRFNNLNANGLLDTANLKPQSAGVFDLKTDKNYQFRAKSYLQAENKDVDYSVTIIRLEDLVVVSDVEMSFYIESGSDDEGYWEEHILEDNFKFQVEKSGKYEVFVSPDYDALAAFTPAALYIQISDAPYSTIYLSVGGFFLFLFLIFQWRRENLIAYANLPHLTILHEIFEKFA